MTVNGVVALAKNFKQDSIIFKVDFEKPYDLVSWSFLEYLPNILGFDNKCCAWIYVFSSNHFVLVSGCPTSEINIQ